MKKNSSIFIAGILSILLVCSIQSCSIKGVKGNGTVVEKEFSITDYDEIQVEGVASVIYEQKADAPYLKIETDENILPLLIVESKDGKLSIRNKEDIRPTKLIVYTHSTRLEDLDASGAIQLHLKNKLITEKLELNMSGSGKIKADDLECGVIEMHVSGATDMMLSGKTDQLRASVSGAGKINALALTAERVECDMSGAGRFEVSANSFLKASISGAGTVRYKGDPQVEKSISGVGKVSRID